MAPYAFVAPARGAVHRCLSIPIGYTVYLSLEKTQVSGLGLGLGARTQVFAGLSNYASRAVGPAVLASLERVVVYSVILVPVMLGLALLFALLLDARRVKFRRFARLSIFLPYAVPTVIGSLLWGFLYLPTVSPFPVILQRLGLVDAEPVLQPPRLPVGGQHRRLGRHRVQHDRDVHRAALGAVGTVRGGPARRGLRSPDRAADQDPDDRARALV